MNNEKVMRSSGHFRPDEGMIRRVMQRSVPSRKATRNYDNGPLPDCKGNYVKNGIEDASSLAMVYAPIQKWNNLYDIETGISRGTIFKELDKPFLPICGNGGC